MQKETFPTYFTVQDAIAVQTKEWLKDFSEKWASIPNLRDDVSWADLRAKFPESPEDFPSFKVWAFANLPYDFNTPTNQTIKAKLVEREVYCCLSDMVEALLKAEAFDLYEYLEFYGTTEGGDEYTEKERDEKVEELAEELEAAEAELLDLEYDYDEKPTEAIEAKKAEIEKLEKEIEELENMDFDELPEVYEWWGVSNWLADKLKEDGRVVVDEFAMSIWGRQTTGQAILLDSVISRIAFDMKILEHQENSWA